MLIQNQFVFLPSYLLDEGGIRIEHNTEVHLSYLDKMFPIAISLETWKGCT